ncbi:MAG TPA: NUDIX hydrolase [Candidatus Saccharimonadales bacterium]|nr:NUDIX hydrolase [Candidatus Saccharimonadales bacterium]
MNPFRLLRSKTIYKNPWISVREDTVIRPGGKEGVFGIVAMLPGSSVLAVDTDNNVLLMQEYKYAVERETLEVISGGIDKNETPLEAAKRELLEEAGVEAEKWVDLGSIDPFTTVVSSPNHLFLATGLTHLKPDPDEGEILQHIIVPYAQALKMVQNGEITHGASCTLILKAQIYIQ